MVKTECAQRSDFAGTLNDVHHQRVANHEHHDDADDGFDKQEDPFKQVHHLMIENGQLIP
ncbi:hypothetical protein D3C77_701310 [compost metagenome]